MASINKKPDIKRRDLVKWLGAGVVCVPLLNSHSLLADTPTGKADSSAKLVWIVLRGALDALHTVIPAFDDHLMLARQQLARQVVETMLPLDGRFGLNRELSTLYDWYQQKQLAPVVAVASTCRQRSHFAAQDELESALLPVNQDSGWLARALEASGKTGIALAHSLPVSLRGSQRSSTWYPPAISPAKGDLYQRLLQLYEQDPLLHQRLVEAQDVRNMVGDSLDDSGRSFVDQSRAAGTLLSNPEGPDAIMLEMGGWDTHDNQHTRLTRQFRTLDSGLQTLRAAMGESTWKHTVIVVATEFGRTVAVNGTGGTDHGTASCLLMAGGGIKGGQVLGDWPGLGQEDLYEGRDLRPTSDIRHWISSVLANHWQLSRSQLETVFPGDFSMAITPEAAAGKNVNTSAP